MIIKQGFIFLLAKFETIAFNLSDFRKHGVPAWRQTGFNLPTGRRAGLTANAV